MKIYEILEAVPKKNSKAKKVKFLQENNSLGLRDILKGAFDDSIQWDLPEGEVPLEEDDIPETPKWNLIDVTPKLAVCVKNKRNAKVPSLKKETTFLELIKNVHPKDAEVLIKMKDKKFVGLYKGLSKSVVMEAFPTLISK